jgi:hypothetical protein
MTLNGEMNENDVLGSMWKEMVLSCFKVISQHLCGGTEEYHEKYQSW